MNVDKVPLMDAAEIFGPDKSAEEHTVETSIDVLLPQVLSFVTSYVVMTKNQAVAVALWVAHRHAFQAADCTPYLRITSATPEAGKTRLLEVLECLTARPWHTGRVSAAVLVRKVDAETPTLMLDETDAAFGGEPEYREALRGILNTGYKRAGKASLCVGKGADLSYRDFSTFCPKAFAGIGALPDTVQGRSIRIELQRRKRNEAVRRFKERYAKPEAAGIRAGLKAWATATICGCLRLMAPQEPDGLSDRAAEVWEPLFAIADHAGGDWPRLAREAAIDLSGHSARQDDASVRLHLLEDLQAIFVENGNPKAMKTKTIIDALAEMEHRPWPEWGRSKKPITAAALAGQLKHFHIVPSGTLWFPDGSAKGYRRAAFEDAWARYVYTDPSGGKNFNNDGPKTPDGGSLSEPSPDGSKSPIHTDKHCVSYVLTAEDRGIRPEAGDADYYGA